MNKHPTKLTRFEDMTVWQESQDLAVLIYKLTRNFPPEEKYGITSQLQRAASSISANIAEGFGRMTTKLEYISKEDASLVINQIESIHKQITAILKYFKNHV